ncbi:hypothetical protein EYF80_045802 [Liparis tanakae]|uniref:Uncharacterized protein n=1 Tax=Liparis tanakae TaxID=230148 RepID=A0A4Z2FS81_9TELE|nr:hypothetical protein EYF80_045802 [Liparis tanakae]
MIPKPIPVGRSESLESKLRGVYLKNRMSRVTMQAPSARTRLGRLPKYTIRTPIMPIPGAVYYGAMKDEENASQSPPLSDIKKTKLPDCVLQSARLRGADVILRVTDWL